MLLMPSGMQDLSCGHRLKLRCCYRVTSPFPVVIFRSQTATLLPLILYKRFSTVGHQRTWELCILLKFGGVGTQSILQVAISQIFLKLHCRP